MPHPSGFPDHFSGVASGYATFRPRYPAALFDWIRSLAPAHARVWDCGAGNGQATMALAERFAHVIATDASAQQVASAAQHPDVTWYVVPAESSGIAPQSIDVVTVAQALHWFDHARFWDEVRRVLRPGGLFVAWTYGDPYLGSAECDAAMHSFAHGTLESYWPPERAHVEARYGTIDVPFTPVAPPGFTMLEQWTLDQFLGYARSWSATTRHAAALGIDAVPELELALRPHWGTAARPVVWPLSVVAARP